MGYTPWGRSQTRQSARVPLVTVCPGEAPTCTRGAASPGRPGPVPSLMVLSRLQTGAATPACVSLSSVTLCSSYLPAA